MKADGDAHKKAWSLSPSSIHRFPDEVLSHIFHLCILHNHESNEQQLSPRTLTHICKRWAQVALSNSSLWCNIMMSVPLTSAQLFETNLLLLRSKTYPIDIELDFRDPFWDWDEDTHQIGFLEMSIVIRTLIPHVDRWRTLTVLTDTWLPIFCLLFTTSSTVLSAPVLTSISLSRCNAYFAAKGEAFKPESLKTPFKLFGGIPLTQLRQLSLVGVHVDWGRSHLVDLHQLELKYHANDVTPSLDEFMRMLSACPRLTKLSIIGSGPQFEYETQSPLSIQSPRPVITLEHLTRFAYGFVDVTYAVEFLSLFHFPALRELELEDVSLTLNPYEERDASTVLKFLAVSRKGSDTEAPAAQGIPLDQVTSLQLRGLCAGQDDFVSFLSHMTNLERLALSDVGDEAVLSLTSRPISLDGTYTANVIGANLEALHCVDVLDYRAVTEAIVARSHLRARALKNLTLEYTLTGGEMELPRGTVAALKEVGVGRFALYSNGRLCQQFSR
ncbi:hypothetical protein AX15_003720 [Amanita polypyramis BW_CC]|nr:hypothetical protein AX15_003720 [Amanita polypyramis BW_CC]